MKGSWREAQPLGSDALGGPPDDAAPAPKKARKKKSKPHAFAKVPPAPSLLALDLASRTGWAASAFGSAPVSGAVDLASVPGREHPRSGSPFCGLARWLADRSWSLSSYLPAVHGLVLEAPGGGAGRLSLIHAAGLRGVALAWAAEHGIPVVSIAPSSLKLWAAGHGRADKAAMIASARRLWPAWAGSDDNEADALCLLAWGLEQAGEARLGP